MMNNYLHLKKYIKALERYEIRMCLYRDCNDRARKLISLNIKKYKNRSLEDKKDRRE